MQLYLSVPPTCLLQCLQCQNQVEDEARGGGEFENLHIKFKREAEKQKKAGMCATGVRGFVCSVATAVLQTGAQAAAVVASQRTVLLGQPLPLAATHPCPGFRSL